MKKLTIVAMLAGALAAACGSKKPAVKDETTDTTPLVAEVARRSGSPSPFMSPIATPETKSFPIAG